MSKTERKEYYYYIIVFTSFGPVYVTDIGEGKTAYWDKDKEPMEFSKQFGRDVVVGLLINLWDARLIESPIKIGLQPYNYKDYKIKFEERSFNEDGEKE